MLKIKAKDLNQALNQCKYAVCPRGALPLLRNVIINGTGSEAVISASDLEAHIAVRVPAEGEFTTCVSHKQLRRLNMAGEVNFNYVNDSAIQSGCALSIECDDMCAEMYYQPDTEFKGISHCDCGSAEISRADVESLIALIPFCSDDWSRAMLCGVRICDGNIAVATDTGIMGIADLETNGLPDMIIPKRTLQILKRIMPPDCDSVKVSWSVNNHSVPQSGDEAKALRDTVQQLAEQMAGSVTAGNIKFEVGNIALTSRCIEGVYPNWRRVIRDEAGTEIPILSAAFLEALQSLLPIAKQHTKCVDIMFAEETAFIVAENLEMLAARRVPCKFGDGAVSQCFSPEYFINMIQFIGYDAFMLWQYGVDAPVIAKCGGRTVVMMPKLREGDLTMPGRIREAVGVGA